MAVGFQRGSKILKPLAWYKSLHEAKDRRENCAFLVEGMRSISLIAQVSPKSILEIIALEDDRDVPPFPCPVRRLTSSQFKSICLSKNPAGPLAVIAMQSDVESAVLPPNRGDRILVCEDIQDPGNIGTLIRTAAALDFSGIILSDKCADPFGPKAVSSSAGTILSVWIRRTPEYLRSVKGLVNAGFSCVAADLHGADSLLEIKPKRFALILGNEGNGLSKNALELATHRIKIPINGKKAESLNVAASGAICMYALTEA